MSLRHDSQQCKAHERRRWRKQIGILLCPSDPYGRATEFGHSEAISGKKGTGSSLRAEASSARAITRAFARHTNQAAGFSSRGGTRGTEDCFGRSESAVTGGKYFKIVCSSDLQISSAISKSGDFSIADADASIRFLLCVRTTHPFIDESARGREVTLHHTSVTW